MHKTASSASLVLEICPQLNNSYLNQFSSISGGNCINLKSTMFHFGVDLLYSTKRPQHDLPSLASPEEEMASSFSWTCFSGVPHQALFVLVTLHLHSSIKSSCCVKLTFVSPSLILFGTPNSLLLQTLFSRFQDLLPTYTKVPTDSPT